MFDNQIIPTSKTYTDEINTSAPNLSPLVKEKIPTDSISGPYIFLLLDQVATNQIKENLMKVLQKLGSSAKTRALHPIVEKFKFKFTIGMVDTLTNESIMSTTSIQNNKLNGFYINIYEVLEPEDRVIIKTINDIIKEINLHKSKITDNNDYILSNLVKNKNEMSNELLSKINYFKIIDIMYMEYLTTLSKIIKFKQNIFKVLESTSVTLGSVLSGLIFKMGGNNPEVINQCQKILLIYLIQHFSTSTDSEIKVFLIKSGILTEEEYREFRSIIHLRTIDDLSKYLTISKIINISPNSLRNNFKNVIGEYGVRLMEGNSMDRLIAYLIINRQQNTLFSTYLNTNTYKSNLENLELLLLNAKSQIII
jgi:hypothetical protein